LSSCHCSAYHCLAFLLLLIYIAAIGPFSFLL
jgi:hypothetical protein